MLFKHPGFSLIALLTLALGIGLSTAIFSMAYSMLLRALPYPEAERLVTVWLTNSAAAAAGYARFNTNAENWLEWRAQSKSFDDIALARTAVNFNLTGDGRPERVLGVQVSWNLARCWACSRRSGECLRKRKQGVTRNWQC
jgi:putative ABC transport system permease protein